MPEEGFLLKSQQNITKNKISLILDSGAFSAWTKQTEVDINKYADFCIEHLSYWRCGQMGLF